MSFEPPRRPPTRAPAAPLGAAVDRRCALRLLGGGALLAAGGSLGSLAGCGGGDEGAVVTAVPLAELPPGERVYLQHDEIPLEVLRTEGAIVARSLLCTHTGCEVSWDAAEEVYRCPCHDGLFNPEGRPIAGPPPRPLATFPVRIEGDEALIGAAAG